MVDNSAKTLNLPQQKPTNMHKQKHLFLALLFGVALLCSSCKGMKFKHGKDCGCGSFSHLELKQDRPQ